MIKREEAENIIQEVQTAVDLWENLAIQLQIPAREMAMFKENRDTEGEAQGYLLRHQD